MKIYVKELKESFFTSGDSLPYRTRQTVMGYFMDEESCRRDSEAERDFYTSKSHYSDLFSKGKTIYMNTTINDRNHYTKMNYSWNPIPLLEVNHRGLSAEEFGAEKYGGLMMGDSLVMVNLTGLEHQQVGFDNFGMPLHRLDKESEKELINRMNKRAKQSRSKRGQEEARLKIKLRKDNDFTFVMDDEYADFSAEEFDAEGINLRKRIEDFIDLREINFTGFKKDTKRDAAKRARRIENEIKGVLPKGKSYKVDKPKWFTIAQTGIVLGLAGLVGYSGFKNEE